MAQRGRPKGATSFVNVDMQSLSKLFGPNQHIPVSRVWLEKLKVNVESSQQTTVSVSPKPTNTTDKIEMTLVA
jgi:hypothetical protein